MKIKRVKLCNFSSYAGEHEIDLSTSGDRNVILIGGNNGAGKTSLFTAIKLALYGPQCFRFQDKNNQYTARIKSLINHDAFLSAQMRAFVEIEISLPSDRRVSDYVIRREWSLDGKNLVERHSVVGDGETLGEKDFDFFQNYLFTVIPPNMFEFFFFDGEEVGEFFAANKHRQFLKEAVLTLSGFDTFHLIQKFCRSFVGSEQEEEEFARAAEQAEAAGWKVEELEAFIEKRTAELEELRTAQSQGRERLSGLKAGFTRAGGMDEAEREKLEAELSALDSAKLEWSKQIRSFVETLMPVFITRDLAAQAEAQLHSEELVRQYEDIRRLLSPEAVRRIMERIPEGAPQDGGAFAGALSAGIADYLRPEVDFETFRKIHDLSEEQRRQVSAIIMNLRNFSADGMIAACKARAEASENYDRLAARLRSALPEHDVREYDAKIAAAEAELAALERDIQTAEREIEQAKRERDEQQALYERLRRFLRQQARYQTAYAYTEKIDHMMTELISSATSAKLRQVAELTLQTFNRIIRKNNFIQLVELDSEFNISLYRKQRYTAEELSILVRNSGADALERRLGSAGIRMAVKALGLASGQDLYAWLSKSYEEGQLSMTDGLTLDLYSRVDMGQLSKGEKQVFILSLYWAVIKSSGQRVPFIIDTPFARIDTEHRTQISQVFFPEISDQVIVLSTDEEVVGAYHAALKPFIAREYLLEYDTETSRTHVTDGYFDEVTA